MIFLWLVLGAVAWQFITVVVFVISGEKEEAAIYCGGGLPLIIAKLACDFYNNVIRKAWCRWMAKRYAVICLSKGDFNGYRIKYDELQKLRIGTSGPGYYAMLGRSPNYNYGAYRRRWEDLDYETRSKYYESDGDHQ